MLDIREALKTALGASFTVNHAGRNGAVVVTVAVADAGGGDAALLPAVFFTAQVGTSENQNIGGRAVRNDAFCDLTVETLDSDDWYGSLLQKDIAEKIETVVRVVEKTLGSSYHSLVASYRDIPAGYNAGGFPVYRRIITVRGVNYEAY